MVKIVGILNITPDSFCDGGKYNSLDSALNHLVKMIDAGADMIDIGAESTRPGAVAITSDEEWLRLKDILPEILKITKSRNIETSIDSYHFENIKKSYELGVDIINDVGGLKDEKIVDFISQKKIKTILMHNQKINPAKDVFVNKNQYLFKDIISSTRNKMSFLKKKGVLTENIIFDIGIGFGKDAWQSILALKYINNFKVLGLPIYVGHSKKSFLAKIDFGSSLSKSEETLIISKYLIDADVQYLRIHDVASHVNLIRS